MFVSPDSGEILHHQHGIYVVKARTFLLRNISSSEVKSEKRRLYSQVVISLY